MVSTCSLLVWAFAEVLQHVLPSCSCSFGWCDASEGLARQRAKVFMGWDAFVVGGRTVVCKLFTIASTRLVPVVPVF
jgi:hypothetical protein